ncbi:PAAR-like protein [Pedobacter caeni]|uniref:TIGR02594 family protein n=1 Tax=Pedobacter caeni TaxID=288992 RepID=A0A1M5BB02_9SPHI|nr:PAAR-like protein [Pedobacter caeni]SHF39595.1 TIGR02594 family protein [Pedobacter caeni]
MNSSTGPEPISGTENLGEDVATDQESAETESNPQKTDEPKQSAEITELLVCQGAKCTCDKAVDASPKKLNVLSHNKYIINDNGESKLLATTLENKILNLNFGQCKVPDPSKPVPCTAKLQWKDYYEKAELPNGAYVLTDKSTATCTAKGGSIKIVQHGQQANVTAQEVENAKAGSWPADSPLLTEELIHTEQEVKNEDKDGASVKSIQVLEYGEQQPLNTPVTFKANFTGKPTAEDKQGVNWVVYDVNGVPMQLRADAGETITITFKKAGTYLIEAYGKTNGDKKVTKPYTIKENEIETVTTVDGKDKVRVMEPVEFRLKSLFQTVAIPGDLDAITWTVTKMSGIGTPTLLIPTGKLTQVLCDEECSYVVAAYFNGVPKQSKVINAIKNGIQSVTASSESIRIHDQVTFTVKDQFKISPARPTEIAAVKWSCKDASGKSVHEFTTKVGETISHKFDQPGEYTIQPYMIQQSSKVAVKIVVAQPKMVNAQWEYPEGGKKNKTGWGEPSHAAIIFESAEGLAVTLEYGYLDAEKKPHAIHRITGLKIPKSQVLDLKGCDFVPNRDKYGKQLKEGTEFYFKILSVDKAYPILSADIPQPVDKLKLVTKEEIVSIEFLSANRLVIQAVYGSKMRCRIRTRNLSTKSVKVRIYRKESRAGKDALRMDTRVHKEVYNLSATGIVEFDFTLDKSWEKSYSEKIHYFYAVVEEMEFRGASNTLVAFKNGVAVVGGQVLVGVAKQDGHQGGDCPRCNEKITPEELKQIFKKADPATLKSVASAYNKYMGDLGMNTCWVKAHFFAQIRVESGPGLHVKSGENFNWYWKSLSAYFGTFKTPEGQKKAKKWGRPEKEPKLPGVNLEDQKNIANWAYHKDGKTGSQLGNKEATDGWDFRGKGLIQLTGRSAYEFANSYTKKEGFDIVSKPDLVLNNITAATLSSMAFFKWKKITTKANGQSDANIISSSVGNEVENSYTLKKEAFRDYTSKIFRINECKWGKLKDAKSSGKRAPWMEFALTEAKTYGGKNEKTIDERIRVYHSKGGNQKKAGNQTAWCASFVNWCILKSDYKILASASSQSFISSNQVEKCTIFYGAIAVFTDCDINGKTIMDANGNTFGHAAFIFGKLANGEYCLLGGNQGDKLRVSNFDCSGKVFYSYTKKDGTKIYKKFKAFYKPKGYVIREIDKLNDDYAKVSDANIKVIKQALKENKNGEKSQ